jgi:hypothetical protein
MTNQPASAATPQSVRAELYALYAKRVNDALVLLSALHEELHDANLALDESVWREGANPSDDVCAQIDTLAALEETVEEAHDKLGEIDSFFYVIANGSVL